MNLSVCMIFKELSSVDKLLLSTAISGVSLNTEYTVGNKGEPLPSRNLKVRVGNIRKYLQTSRFIVLCFTVLPRNCALFVWVLVFVFFVFFFFFHKLEVCGNPAQSKSISASYSTAFVHFLSLGHILMILTFQAFPLLLQLLW